MKKKDDVFKEFQPKIEEIMKILIPTIMQNPKTFEQIYDLFVKDGFICVQDGPVHFHWGKDHAK